MPRSYFLNWSCTFFIQVTFYTSSGRLREIRDTVSDKIILLCSDVVLKYRPRESSRTKGYVLGLESPGLGLEGYCLGYMAHARSFFILLNVWCLQKSNLCQLCLFIRLHLFTWLPRPCMP
jgi:hypothetical protein